MKKLLILLLVLGIAGVASAANDIQDFEGYTLGDLEGQGNWEDAPWTTNNNWQVVSETGNQYTRSAGDGATEFVSYNNLADIDLAADPVWSVSWRMRYSDPIDALGTGTPSQIQFHSSDGGDPIHLKLDPGAGGLFRMNDGAQLDMVAVHEENVNGTWGGGAEADYYKDYVGQWVKCRIDMDAANNSVQAYWELNDGSMAAIGDPRGLTGGSGASSVVTDYMILARSATGQTIDFDDINITPEPATIMMLGLGGLALIRRKRC